MRDLRDRFRRLCDPIGETTIITALIHYHKLPAGVLAAIILLATVCSSMFFKAVIRSAQDALGELFSQASNIAVLSLSTPRT